MKIKNRILLFLKPIQMWLQRRGYIESDFTQSEVDEIVGLIRAGDILLSYESGRWTSYFIKCEWDHAAMVNDALQVVEAVGDNIVNGVNLGGVRKVGLYEWICKKNHILVLRHKDQDAAFKASELVNDYIGSGYDYAFKEGNEYYYCSELVYVSYKPFDNYFINRVDSKSDILPIDYLDDSHLEIIYNSRL